MENREEISGEELETYALVYTALKHPIRRKILRMLARSPLTFTEIQDVLKINSAHLSYHLNAMKELLNQTERGKYLLSTFGDATLGLMRKVEETEEIRPRKRNAYIRNLWFSLPLIIFSSMLILTSAYFLINPPSYNILTQKYSSVEGILAHSFYKKSNTEIYFESRGFDGGLVINNSAPFIMYVAKSDVNLTYHELKEYLFELSSSNFTLRKLAADFLLTHGIIPSLEPDYPCIAFSYAGAGGGGGVVPVSASGEYSLVIRAEEGPANFSLEISLVDLSYNDMFRALLLANLCFIMLYSEHFSSIENWIEKKRIVWSWKCLTVDMLALFVIIFIFYLSWANAIMGTMFTMLFRSRRKI